MPRRVICSLLCSGHLHSTTADVHAIIRARVVGAHNTSSILHTGHHRHFRLPHHPVCDCRSPTAGCHAMHRCTMSRPCHAMPATFPAGSPAADRIACVQGIDELPGHWPTAYSFNFIYWPLPGLELYRCRLRRSPTRSKPRKAAGD